MSGGGIEAVLEAALRSVRMVPFSDGNGGHLWRSARPDEQAAHVAPAVLAWLDARLAEGDVVEAVARGIDAVESISHSSHGHPGTCADHAATAALSAVRGVLGGEGSC